MNMQPNKKLLSLSLMMSFMGVCIPSIAQEQSPKDVPQTLHEHIDDGVLTGKIKTQLLADSTTHGLNINVDSDQGVVTLRGTAKTQQEKEKAGAIAQQTEGTVRVRNELLILSR